MNPLVKFITDVNESLDATIIKKELHVIIHSMPKEKAL
jgi:hypothetical protein